MADGPERQGQSWSRRLWPLREHRWKAKCLTDKRFPNEITLIDFSKHSHLDYLVLPLALPHLLLVFSPTFLTATELRHAGVSLFTLQ